MYRYGRGDFRDQILGSFNRYSVSTTAPVFSTIISLKELYIIMDMNRLYI